jgi:hypothetical protein
MRNATCSKCKSPVTCSGAAGKCPFCGGQLLVKVEEGYTPILSPSDQLLVDLVEAEKLYTSSWGNFISGFLKLEQIKINIRKYVETIKGK